MKQLIVSLLLTPFLTITALSQSVSLFNLDKSDFPRVSADVYFFNERGENAAAALADVSIREEEQVRPVLSLTCPSPEPPKPLSSVLVIDVSGSMGEVLHSGESNIEIARSAASVWVNALPLAQSESAVTSFDEKNYLNQDFTTDRSALLDAIDNLEPKGETDYRSGLIGLPAGALQVSRNGKYRRVIVFLSDGYSDSPLNSQEIIDEANRQNCAIYVVTLQVSCPQVLRDIAEQTGGDWVQSVTTATEAREAYMRFLAHAQDVEPCRIVWEGMGCYPNFRTAELRWDRASSRALYYVNGNFSQATLFPRSMYFGVRSPSNRYDTTVALIASTTALTVTNITSSNPAFDINPKSFTMAEGDWKDLTVSFTPSDSSYAWTEFTFETDQCPVVFVASGGRSGPNSSITLELDHPDGGEIFPILSDTVITWSGIPPGDPVNIDYSIDAGANWSEIVRGAIGGSYVWNVPATPSDSCLVRVALAIASEETNGLIRSAMLSLNGLAQGSWNGNGTTVAVGGTISLWDVGDSWQTVHSSVAASTFSWSPDGSAVAGAGYGKIGVLDAATMFEHRRLERKDLICLALAWSPDGTELVSGWSDSTVVVWDVASGEVLRTLPKLDGKIYAIEWSPTVDQFAVADAEPRITVWDGATGELLRDIPVASDPTSVFTTPQIEWSPEGDRIYHAGGTDARVRVFDVASESELAVMPGHDVQIFDLDLSPDGAMLATTGADDRTIVWDTESLQEVHRIENAAERLAWSADSRLLATSVIRPTTGKMFDINVWKRGTWQNVALFRGHTRFVQDLEWHPDPYVYRLLSVSMDGTAKVWGLPNDSPIGDVSDSLFSIVDPELNMLDVDMGKVPVGEVKDSVVVGFIVNPYTFPVVVESVDIAGPDAPLFSVDPPGPPWSLPPGSSRSVAFRFAPVAVGPRSAELSVRTGDDVIMGTIRGEGIEPQVAVVQESIDFGPVNVGEQKDLLQQITIRNVGEVPVTIESVRHGGPNSADFSTLAGGGTFRLDPGEGALLDLRFAPSQPGPTSGTLLFDYDGSGSPATVLLMGEGLEVEEPASATLGTGRFTGTPGERITIPVRLLEQESLARDGVTGFRTELRFDATLLEPTGGTPSGRIVDGERIIELLLPGSPVSGDVLASFEFRIGLGGDSVTPLTLQNAESIGAEAVVTTDVGSFALLGICYNGGARLINPDGEVALRAVGGNSATEGEGITVELETIEYGRTTLRLHDLHGRTVRTYVNGEVDPGRRVVTLQCEGLSGGTYFLVLQTTTVRKEVKIEVAP